MIRIGFIGACPLPEEYKRVRNTTLASTRIRCIDVMEHLELLDNFEVSVFKPGQRYDIVVFQKRFGTEDIEMAQGLKRDSKIKLVFDIGTDYLHLDSECVSEAQRYDCLELLKFMDVVSVSSPYLKDVYSQEHTNVHYIPDAVETRFIGASKKHSNSSEDIKLLYCGFSKKASEVLLIEDTLKELHSKFGIKLVFICEKDPRIDIIPYEFYKYDQETLPFLLLKGDIKIAPRDLTRSYNRGHSVLKIAYPMSVGLPVVASPVASYIPFLLPSALCKTASEWFNQLSTLIKIPTLRNISGELNKSKVKHDLTIYQTSRVWKKFYESVFKL